MSSEAKRWVERNNQLEKQLSELRTKKNFLEKQRTAIRNRDVNSGAAMLNRMKEQEEIERQIIDCEKEISKLKKQIDDEADMEFLGIDPATVEDENSEEEAAGALKIDKAKFFKNVRNLIKLRGVKISQIEKDAGCSVGYMSRVDKPDSNTMPTLNFVISAATNLGVTVEDLLYGTVEDVSDQDLYFMDFVQALDTKTKNEEIEWKQYVLDNDSPFYRETQFDANNNGTEYFVKFFVSSFVDGRKKAEAADAIAAPLTPTSRLVIIPVVDDGQDKVFYELYLLEGSSNYTPMLETSACNATLASNIGTLYENARKGMNKLNIDERVKSVIDQFMATGKRGEV